MASVGKSIDLSIRPG